MFLLRDIRRRRARWTLHSVQEELSILESLHVALPILVSKNHFQLNARPRPTETLFRPIILPRIATTTQLPRSPLPTATSRHSGNARPLPSENTHRLRGNLPLGTNRTLLFSYMRQSASQHEPCWYDSAVNSKRETATAESNPYPHQQEYSIGFRQPPHYSHSRNLETVLTSQSSAPSLVHRSHAACSPIAHSSLP